MIDLERRAVRFSRDLAHVNPSNLTVRRGALEAALVVLPLAVGLTLGLAAPSVFVTIGALNLLLVEAPYPARTRSRVLVVAAGTNAIAVAAGTLIGLLPGYLVLPFVAAGIFAALWGTRSPEWENASFIAAVMFALSVGLPSAVGPGLYLRAAAVAIGGVWVLASLAVLALLRPRKDEGAAPLPAVPPPTSPALERTVTLHVAVVAAVATLGLYLGIELGLPRDYWVMIMVLVALRPDLATTLSYSAARIVGTVIGAAGAFVATTLTSEAWILFPVLTGAVWLALSTRSVNQIVYSIGIALAIIVLLNLAYSGGPALAVARVIDTVLGGALALAAALALAGVGSRRNTRAAGG